MKYYSVTVELYIEADNQHEAFSIIENHIDNIVSNNREMQDYYISKNIIEEVLE
jgi:hypothetical protein